MADRGNEQSIFLKALDFTSPSDRAAYLAEECRDRPELRHELDALLAAHDRLGGSVPEGPTLAYPQAGEKVGTVLGGRYKLLEVIGEGGMGTVWMAQQQEPVRRSVAVKLIKPGMDSKA